jgi:hypothetical protein
MTIRAKEIGGSRRPDPPWIPAAQIGIGITTLAAGVIAMSVGLALGKAILRG